MIPMGELTVEDRLLQIAHRRRKAGISLPEFHEMLFHELLTHTSLEQPRLKVLHVPAIECELCNVVASEQNAEMIGNKLVTDGLPRSQRQHQRERFRRVSDARPGGT